MLSKSGLASTFQLQRANRINLEYWIKQRSQGREAWLQKNQRQCIACKNRYLRSGKESALGVTCNHGEIPLGFTITSPHIGGQ